MHACVCYLEGVEAGDDAAVLHVAGARGVSKLALGVGARARASLELAAHLQRQPLGVPAYGDVDGHNEQMDRCELKVVLGEGKEVKSRTKVTVPQH